MTKLLIGFALLTSMSSFASVSVCTPVESPEKVVLQIDSKKQTFEFLKPGNMIQYDDTAVETSGLISTETIQWINTSGIYGKTGLVLQILLVELNQDEIATSASNIFLRDGEVTAKHDLECRSK